MRTVTWGDVRWDVEISLFQHTLITIFGIIGKRVSLNQKSLQIIDRSVTPDLLLLM